MNINELAPTVPFQTGSYDAAAGAYLIKERWPDAKLIEVENSEACNELELKEPIWVLGVRPGTLVLHGPFVLEPGQTIPVASIVMQVYRKLNPCETCDSVGMVPDAEGNGTKTCESCSPPWWVWYLDAVVREDWNDNLFRHIGAFSHWMESWPPAMLFLTHAAGGVASWSQCHNEIVQEGYAIRRAKKQWEKGNHFKIYSGFTASRDVKIENLRDRIQVQESEIIALRAQRDQLTEYTQVAPLEGEKLANWMHDQDG